MISFRFAVALAAMLWAAVAPAQGTGAASTPAIFPVAAAGNVAPATVLVAQNGVQAGAVDAVMASDAALVAADGARRTFESNPGPLNLRVAPAAGTTSGIFAGSTPNSSTASLANLTCPGCDATAVAAIPVQPSSSVTDFSGVKFSNKVVNVLEAMFSSDVAAPPAAGMVDTIAEDDIVSAVPPPSPDLEPDTESYALVFAGLVLVGLLFSRRGRRHAAA